MARRKSKITQIGPDLWRLGSGVVIEQISAFKGENFAVKHIPEIEQKPIATEAEVEIDKKPVRQMNLYDFLEIHPLLVLPICPCV